MIFARVLIDARETGEADRLAVVAATSPYCADLAMMAAIALWRLTCMRWSLRN
jgi:hypothetical protein